MGNKHITRPKLENLASRKTIKNQARCLLEHFDYRLHAEPAHVAERDRWVMLLHDRNTNRPTPAAINSTSAATMTNINCQVDASASGTGGSVRRAMVRNSAWLISRRCSSKSGSGVRSTGSFVLFMARLVVYKRLRRQQY